MAVHLATANKVQCVSVAVAPYSTPLSLKHFAHTHTSRHGRWTRGFRDGNLFITFKPNPS